MSIQAPTMEAVKHFMLDDTLDPTREIEERIAPAPSPLLGTWNNTNPATRGIVKVILAQRADKFLVHVYGACHPTPCDWGVVEGWPYGRDVTSRLAMAFSAHYDQGFKEALVTGYLQGDVLIVMSYNKFTDGSNRFDYFSMERFHK